MEQAINIPSVFLVAPFFQAGEASTIVYNASLSFEETMCKAHFVYEIAALQGYEMYQPWKDAIYALPVACTVWKEERVGIAPLFRQRERAEVRTVMIQFIAHFISLLYWANGTYCSSLQDLKKTVALLPVKPFNVVERLSFILESPHHHHSFIQLSQLYEELEKQFSKQIATKKTSPYT